jgi:hypothetical protein
MEVTEALRTHLDKVAASNDQLISIVKDLIREIDSSGKTSEQIDQLLAATRMECRLDELEAKVFAFIRTKRMVTKNALTSRFSRKIRASQLHGPEGLITKMIRSSLITEFIDYTGVRETTFYRVTDHGLVFDIENNRVKVVEKTVIPPTDSRAT